MWNRFTPLQLAVMGVAAIAPLVIAGTISAALLGLISVETMLAVAIGAGENPGIVTFGAMYLASPVQWLTGRSQVRVRKYLGIIFFLLAASNLAMFVVETGASAVLSAPFLVAGTVAVALAAPLFLTSSRRSQRALGMHRWRVLHQATHLVAVALLAHVLLIPDPGPGAAMITGGLVARIPPIRRWLTSKARRPQTATVAKP